METVNWKRIGWIAFLMYFFIDRLVSPSEESMDRYDWIVFGLCSLPTAVNYLRRVRTSEDPTDLDNLGNLTDQDSIG